MTNAENRSRKETPRKPTALELAEAKNQGFFNVRGSCLFSARIASVGGSLSAEQLIALGNCAKRFGNGTIVISSRLSAELPGIARESFAAVQSFVAEHGMAFSRSGPRVRPVTACMGTYCVKGTFDTQAMAREIYERYYLGWQDVKLPNRFKISVGGCPNSCVKPSINDFGIEGHIVPPGDGSECRGCPVCNALAGCPSQALESCDGVMRINREKCDSCGICLRTCPFHTFGTSSRTQYKITVGGMWGRRYRVGNALSRFVERDEIFPILEKMIVWYRDHGVGHERLGATIDRLGMDVVEAALLR